MTKTSQDRGFSLIELSITLMIVGLLMGSMLTMMNLYFKNHSTGETVANLQKAQIALKAYVEVNGSYPCPASAAARRGSPKFGKAVETCAADDAVLLHVDGRDKKNVVLGILPFRSLGLPDSVAKDGWGNILQYAVTQSLTNFNTYDPRNGAIDIIAEDRQSRLTPPVTAQYAVLSTGQDGKGGYTADIVPLSACPSGVLETENCNGDAVFMDAQKSNAGGTADYDDYIVYQQYDPLENNHGGLLEFFRGNCGIGFAPVNLAGFNINDFNAAGIETLSRDRNPAPSASGAARNLCYSAHFSLTMMIQAHNSDANPEQCPLGWSNIGYKIFGAGDSGAIYKVCAR